MPAGVPPRSRDFPLARRFLAWVRRRARCAGATTRKERIMNSKTVPQRGFGRIALIAGAAGFAAIGIGLAVQTKPAGEPAAQLEMPASPPAIEAPASLPQLDDSAEHGGNVSEYN
jgi:hypothetical protein